MEKQVNNELQCSGEGCPRRDECARYANSTYFGKRKPFLTTLCQWLDNNYHADYFVPVEQVRADSQVLQVEI